MISGSLVVAKGIWYYFNVLNEIGHFGYFYDPKVKTWVKLEKRGIIYTYKEQSGRFPIFESPLTTVPYFG